MFFIGFPPPAVIINIFPSRHPLIGLRIGIITVRSFVSKVVMVQIFRRGTQEIPLVFVVSWSMAGVQLMLVTSLWSLIARCNEIVLVK